eukprot:s2110_g4.t1
MNLHSLALLLVPSSAVTAATASVDTANVLTTFRHMQGWRCKTRMFSALHLPDHLEMVEKVQQASVWCSHHPGCYGVQFYNAGPEEDFMYCMKWCGQPQWCLAPILEEDAEGLQADELVQDNLFYLLVKPRPASDSLVSSPLQGPPARCSYAGRVGPCFDPLAREACRARKFKPGERAFVFADDLQRRAEWMDHLEDSYILHLQRKWAEPNGVDVVLILPDDTTARYPISGAQRSALMRMGVRILEVPWIRPELGKGIPSWAQQVWCVDRDFFKLHALGLEYDAIVFYDTDVFVNPPDFSHLEAVFNCAYQGYFLASALHGGFEPLTVAFFALRPSPALLRAVQRFLLEERQIRLFRAAKPAEELVAQERGTPPSSPEQAEESRASGSARTPPNKGRNVDEKGRVLPRTVPKARRKEYPMKEVKVEVEVLVEVPPERQEQARVRQKEKERKKAEKEKKEKDRKKEKAPRERKEKEKDRKKEKAPKERKEKEREKEKAPKERKEKDRKEKKERAPKERVESEQEKAPEEPPKKWRSRRKRRKSRRGADEACGSTEAVSRSGDPTGATESAAVGRQARAEQPAEKDRGTGHTGAEEAPLEPHFFTFISTTATTMADDSRGDGFSNYIPVWDGQAGSMRKFKKSVSLWLAGLDLSKTASYNLAARFLLRQTGAARARGEEEDIDALAYRPGVTDVVGGEITEADYTHGVWHLVRCFEELCGKPASEKRGELRQRLYISLRATPNEAVANFASQWRTLVAECIVEGIPVTPVESGWLFKERLALAETQRQLLETGEEPEFAAVEREAFVTEEPDEEDDGYEDEPKGENEAYETAKEEEEGGDDAADERARGDGRCAG